MCGTISIGCLAQATSNITTPNANTSVAFVALPSLVSSGAIYPWCRPDAWVGHLFHDCAISQGRNHLFLHFSIEEHIACLDVSMDGNLLPILMEVEETRRDAFNNVNSVSPM